MGIIKSRGTQLKLKYHIIFEKFFVTIHSKIFITKTSGKILDVLFNYRRVSFKINFLLTEPVYK